MPGGGCTRAPYELLMQLEEIEHRPTQVRRPQSIGFIERFHRTLLDEHLRVTGRTTWYETIDAMQALLPPCWRSTTPSGPTGVRA